MGKNSIFILYIPVADVVDSTVITANSVVTRKYYCGFQKTISFVSHSFSQSERNSVHN